MSQLVPERRSTGVVEIASSTDEEVHQLFGLARSVFGDAPGWSDDRVLGVLSRDLVFVAREHGQPAGYVALRPTAQEAALVEQLFVAPGHEQRGIGHRLLEFAEGYAISEKMKTLRVVVEEENLAARSFYQRSGFVPIGSDLFELVLPRPG
jgi:ribosomal protein S18 acetylase RimI-like enzyme